MGSLLNHFKTITIGDILLISQVLSGILAGITVILNFLWCGYFINHWLIVKKRIKYLRQQRCETELEILANSRVDYVKSSYIIHISLTEIFSALMVPVIMLTIKFTENNTSNNNNNTITELENCSHDRFIVVHQNLMNRVLPSITAWLVFNIFWLLIGLNSYLNKAYSTKRIIGHREPIVWYGITINTVMAISIASYWKALIFLVPITPIISIIQFLILYKSTRKLYENIMSRFLV